MLGTDFHTGHRPKVPQWLSRCTEPQFLFPIVAVLALVMIWGTTLTYMRGRLQDVQISATLTTRELLNTYEAQTVRALGQIEQALSLVEFWHERGEQRALDTLKEHGLLPPDLLFSVSIVDAGGKVIQSTQDSIPVDVGGADFFTAQREGAVAFVGRLSARSGRDAQLVFSRRLDGPDGRFDGVVTVSVDAAYFVSGYDEAKLGKQGLLALIGADGYVRVRRSGDVVSFGGAVDYARQVGGVGEEGAAVRVASDQGDGLARWTSATELFSVPLAVAVGLSVDEQTAAAQRATRAYLWLAVLGSALAVASLAVLGRMSWKLARGRERETETRRQHAERVEYLAYHDGLTGLPNRSLFSKLLSQSMSTARRQERRLAVVFLDLDLFKRINDTLGHDAGDELLSEVATRVKSCVRESDTVARLGGDEFVVLLPEIDDETQAATVAQKILAAIARPFTLGNQEMRVTASIGIAVCPQDGIDEQTLKKNADVAMYKAKSEGKNNYQFYTNRLDSTSLERLSLESNLRHALERGEFKLHYQAKRDIPTGRITGMEALLRWEHPDLGTVAPMNFLPVAEETGLIIAIGRWVLKTACDQNVAWQKQGLPSLCIAVNLTEKQFFDERMVEDVMSGLVASGMEPWLLELEIPESVLSRRVTDTLRILARLKAVGIRIAVGDFGVGYTSLTMLQRFPFDTIKIDRSLVRDLVDGVDNSALADSIIAMGRSLSMTVVAQGVETSEQAEFLRKHACDELQGFYFRKPLPAEEFAQLLQAQGNAPAAVPAVEATPARDLKSG